MVPYADNMYNLYVRSSSPLDMSCGFKYKWGTAQAINLTNTAHIDQACNNYSSNKSGARYNFSVQYVRYKSIINNNYYNYNN